MKKIILAFTLLLGCSVSQAQIGIGVPNPAVSAALDLTSTTKGFLPPRMTSLQRDAIASPVAGLMVYNTDSKKVEWYDGTIWVGVEAESNKSTDVALGTSDVLYPTQNAVKTYVDGYVDPNSFYTANGTLTGSRTVTQNNNNLTFVSGTAKTIVNGNFQTNGLLYAKPPRVHPIATSITWQADDVVILLVSTHSGNIVFPSASANLNRLVGINNRSGAARIITNITGGDTGIYADEAVSQIASGSGVSWWISDGSSWRLYSGRP